MWKGDTSGSGHYSSETTLTPQNVNPTTFGLLGKHDVDGLMLAQPLYVSQLDMGDKGTHDVVIVATEHASVYALDAKNLGGASLWERHFAINGATPAPDNFGGRTTLGGEIGITGTPVIDPKTGVMYFVTMLMVNGAVEQRLHAVDVKSGNDFGPGSVVISASYPGDGRGSSGGVIKFDPLNHNQRSGLVINNDAVIIAWGSFSDWGVYHGWLMAYGLNDLQQRAVLNTSPQFQAQDDANGPADHGGGAAIWQGGAAPSIDANGNIYLVGADGSTNSQSGGKNHGDSVLRIKYTGSDLQVTDWFSPSNAACLDLADMEIGSGGVALLPGGQLGVSINKEGRLYLLNLAQLGGFNPAGDTQIPQAFMVGSNECFDGLGPEFAEGPNWQRLYGNVSFFNNNLYVAPANDTLKQFAFDGAKFNPTPAAQSPTATGLRGGNTVVSSNGNNNGIVWMYEKTAQGRGVLHAYDATNISHELWNSGMNSRDLMGTGIGFGTPVVVNGRVVTVYDKTVVIYGPLS
jgi:hypothetical protein